MNAYPVFPKLASPPFFTSSPAIRQSFAAVPINIPWTHAPTPNTLFFDSETLVKSMGSGG